MNPIKQRLKQLRQEQGLTMADFAKCIGVSAGNVGDWESEARSSIPGAHALVSIANAFEISIDWLLLGKTPGDEKIADPAQAKQSTAFHEMIESASALSAPDLKMIAELASRIAYLSGQSDSKTMKQD